MRERVLWWTKVTMRFQAASCASFHMPVQPWVIRASGETSVISVTRSPAPPIARLPRCTRCQSPGTPSVAEYWHIGLTTMRFSSRIPRSESGVKIGGGALPAASRGAPAASAKCSVVRAHERRDRAAPGHCRR